MPSGAWQNECSSVSFPVLFCAAYLSLCTSAAPCYLSFTPGKRSIGRVRCLSASVIDCFH